jgi:tRNA G10  N-methylase Trm11
MNDYMILNSVEPISYLYTYSCHEDERALCRLEMRSLFEKDTESSILESFDQVDPSRSPFIKERIEVIFKAASVEELVCLLEGTEVEGSTFKVVVVKNEELDDIDNLDFKERRSIEREIGLRIRGSVDLSKPEIVLAILKRKKEWIFGRYKKSKAIWLHHQKKPHNYSTALSTRVARAVVNIAVPNPSNTKAIDPCCGIGTVLIEALSMGIDIVGRDLNPLVIPGARANIQSFSYDTEVTLGDIRHVTRLYDVAIIDMPYNLCSVLSTKEQLEMLTSARSFAKKAVIITIESIDSIIKEAGFEIMDRCLAKKGSFGRQIIVCK